MWKNKTLGFQERVLENLNIQSCKLYHKKYMIASTQNINTETFAFIAALAFKLLNCKLLCINRKDNRKRLKVGYFSVKKFT